LNQSHAHPVPPPQIAAAGVLGSTTAHGEDGHEQAWGGATDRSEPADTGAGAESGDGNGNGNAYSNGSSGDGGGDNEAETSAGAATQFASVTSPAPGAAAGTSTPDGTAWQQPAASETSDDASQPVSQEPRDN
jgi:hypothetical protein